MPGGAFYPLITGNPVTPVNTVENTSNPPGGTDQGRATVVTGIVYHTDPVFAGAAAVGPDALQTGGKVFLGVETYDNDVGGVGWGGHIGSLHLPPDRGRGPGACNPRARRISRPNCTMFTAVDVLQPARDIGYLLSVSNLRLPVVSGQNAYRLLWSVQFHELRATSDELRVPTAGLQEPVVPQKQAEGGLWRR